MAPQLNLKILLCDRKVCKTIALDPSLLVYDVCKTVRDKEGHAFKDHQFQEWGLFLSHDDPQKGIWLESGRTLEYYLLRDGDTLEYRKKIRALRVKMMDDSVKTILVDDSQPVSQLMIAICSRIGIANYEEYSLVRDSAPWPEDGKYGTLPTGTGGTAASHVPGSVLSCPDGPGSTYGTLRAGDTLRGKDKTLTRDQRKMEQLKRKLHTDDEINWVDHAKTLREQGIDDAETLLLRRKYFYSDQNIDSRDPVQLNLLYVQCRDAIVNGTHPVTLFQACQFAGIQCQIQFGNYDPLKHRTGFLDLNEFIVKDFRKMKGLERKVYEEHKVCSGDGEIDAKVRYVKLARGLKTYGVTFFLVKEKMKGKNKLTPRLLGVTKDTVLRLDEKTKEIIKTWQLTSVKRWAASPNSFTLDFGDYQDAYYSVQTPDGEQISRLLAGYIDIILKRKKAKERTGIEGDDESSLVEEIVSPHRATYVQLKRPIGQRHDRGPEAGRIALTGTLGHVTPTRASGALAASTLGTAEGGGSAPRVGTETDPRLPDHATLTGRVRISGPAHPSQRARVIGLCRAQVEAGIRSLSGLSRGAVLTDAGAPLESAVASGPVRSPKGLVEAVTGHVAAVHAASAQIVSLLAMTGVTAPSGGPLDGPESGPGPMGDALKHAISQVTSCLQDLVRDVFHLSGAQRGTKDDGHFVDACALELDQEGRASLLSAARELAQATSDMLECLNGYGAESLATADVPEEAWQRDHEAQILTARVLQNQERNLSAHLTKIGEAGARVLNLVRGTAHAAPEPDSQEASAILLGLAKGVANAAACLVLRAKTVANHCVSPGTPPDQSLPSAPSHVSEVSRAEREWDRDRIVMAATRCAMRTSELVTCVKIMAPTMNTAVCRDQTVEAAKCVNLSVDHVLEAAQDVTTHEKLLSDLKNAAAQVVDALDKLIEKVTEGVPTSCDVTTVDGLPNDGRCQVSQVRVLEDKEKRAFHAIENATARMMQFGPAPGSRSAGDLDILPVDSSLMIQEARIVAQATSDLVAAIKGEAQRVAASGDNESLAGGSSAAMAGRQKSLFEAAKELAEATARLVETAKQFASNPSKTPSQAEAQNLARAAANLRLAARTAIDRISSHRVMAQLQNAAKDSGESAAHVIKITQQVLESQSEKGSLSLEGDAGAAPEHDLISQCKLVGDRLADLMSGIEGCNLVKSQEPPQPARTKPGSSGSPGATLVHSCDRFLGPALKLTQLVSEGTTPLVRNRLSESVCQLTRSLGQLKTCSDQAHQIYEDRLREREDGALKESFLDALERIEGTKNRILTRSPENRSENRGQYCTRDKEHVVEGAKAVGADMAAFITAVVKGQERASDVAVDQLAGSLERFAGAVRVVAVRGSEPQRNQIGSELLTLRAAAVLDKCIRAIREAGSPQAGQPQSQHNLSTCARDLSTCLNDLINALPTPSAPSDGEAKPEKLARALAKVKEAQLAIRTAASTPDNGKIDFSSLPMHEKRRVFEQYHVTLHTRARDLNRATQNLLKASTCSASPTTTLSRSGGPVATAAEQFSLTLHSFVQAGITVLSTKEEPAARQKLVSGLERVSHVATQLLSTAQQTVVSDHGNPSSPRPVVGDDLRNRLVLAARAVTDTINELINYCSFNDPYNPTSDNPPALDDAMFGDTCRAECQAARQSLQVCKSMIEAGPFTHYPRPANYGDGQTVEPPAPDLSYHKISGDLRDFARQIDRDVERMTHFARENDLSDFGVALTSWAKNATWLVDKVAQCAYVMSLVHEISDPSTIPDPAKERLSALFRAERSNPNPGAALSHGGVLNVAQLDEAANAINEACADIRASPPNANQQRILTAATVIAKHTSSLCNCCRLASSRTQDSELKKFFVRSAKEVANATSDLVKRIKGLDAGELSSGSSPAPPTTDRRGLAQALDTLVCAVKMLVDYAAANGAPTNANPTSDDVLKDLVLSQEALQNQQPLLETGASFCHEALAMVTSCQRLANDPKSVNHWHEFSRRSHGLSLHMSTLVTISRDLAPGQVNCDRTSRKLYDMLNELEAITMEALNRGLSPNPANTSQGFRERVDVCAAQLLTSVDSLRMAGKAEIGLIGMKLNQFDGYVRSLVESHVGHVSHSCSVDSRKMLTGLDRLKTVLESSQQLVAAIKEGGGDPGAEGSVHETIDETAEAVKESLRDLTQSLEDEVDATSASDLSSAPCDTEWLVASFSRLVEQVKRGIVRLADFDQYGPAAAVAPTSLNGINDGNGWDEAKAEADLRAQIGRSCALSRDIARMAHFIGQELGSSPTPPSPDGQSEDPSSGSVLESGASRMVQLFDQLIDSFLSPGGGIVAHLAALTPLYALCPNNASNTIYELPDRLRYATRQLGEGCLDMIRFTGAHQPSTNPGYGGPVGRTNGSSPAPNRARLTHNEVETARYFGQKVEEKANHIMHVLEAIYQVLPPDAAKRRTERACTQAGAILKGLIGDLDTTVLFATTGSLKPDTDDCSSNLFTQHRDVILKTAKSLVEDTKTLVAGAASNPEQLAAAAQSAVRTITKLSEEVKLGAAALGPTDPEAQVLLINAIKDVASALGDLIQATKQASGKPLSDPAMGYLKESAKVMVTNVTSLLKTVKTVEDAKLRGTRALESTIQALTQELRAYESYEAPLKSTCPDELHRSVYNVHCAASDICMAADACSQEEVISASNQSRRAVLDLLRACKGAAQYAEGEDGKASILEGGKCIAIKCRDMLDILHQIVTTIQPQGPSHPEAQGNNVARLRGEMELSFSDLNHLLDRFTRLTNETLRVTTGHDGSACYYFSDSGSLYSNNTSNPSLHQPAPGSLAENELLSAASAIEAAARNLAVLEPVVRPKPRSVATKNIEYKLAEEDELKQNFDGQILEAAKAIANATAALIRAASAAQRELVMQGKLSPDTLPRTNGSCKNRLDIYGKEGQWSYGLISAAKLVVAATHSMCEAANDLVKQKRNRLSQENELGASGVGQEHKLTPSKGDDPSSAAAANLLTTCEERLVSSAKSVASSTAQLLVACKVKAGVHNPVTENLQRAGTAIKRATDQLVRAATRAIGRKRQCSTALLLDRQGDPRDLATAAGDYYDAPRSGEDYEEGEEEESAVRYITIDKRMVGSLAQEMEAQQEILRKERELEEARVRLGVIRKAKYKEKNSLIANSFMNGEVNENDYQAAYGVESDIYSVPVPSPNHPAYINTTEECNYSDF